MTPLHDEDDLIVDPELAIVDSHHHLWLHPHSRYLIDEFAADLNSGHKVESTVYVECSAMYRRTGPAELRTVGEAEFVAGIAAMSDSGLFGSTRMCAAFVGATDLRLGAQVEEVLDALATASGGRFRGIRGTANWDANPVVNTGVRPFAPQGLLNDPRFREGVAAMAVRNLVYDAWQYHPQLPDVCGLADAFPELTLVVDHCGGLLGIGPYAGADTFQQWKSLMADVARRPNTFVKLGGLSAGRCGFGFAQRPSPAPAKVLAELWRPYIETCIELFGPSRCMYESNFPPDRVSGSYKTLWNALKLTASRCSTSEKEQLFSGTAKRVYRIVDTD